MVYGDIWVAKQKEAGRVQCIDDLVHNYSTQTLTIASCAILLFFSFMTVCWWSTTGACLCIWFIWLWLVWSGTWHYYFLLRRRSHYTGAMYAVLYYTNYHWQCNIANKPGCVNRLPVFNKRDHFKLHVSILRQLIDWSFVLKSLHVFALDLH